MVQSYYEDQLYLAEPSFVARPGAGLEAKADGLEAEDDGGIPGYDGRFYAERMAAALGRITEAFGWNAKELFDGNRQTTLFSF